MSASMSGSERRLRVTRAFMPDVSASEAPTMSREFPTYFRCHPGCRSRQDTGLPTLGRSVDVGHDPVMTTSTHPLPPGLREELVASEALATAELRYTLASF